MADITSKLANLSEARRAEILAKVRGGQQPRGIQPRTTATAPASFVQEQMWLLNLLAPDEPAYNVPFALELDGPLDPAAVRAVCARLQHRHEVLRARLVLRDGRLVQDHAEHPAEINQLDLTVASEEQIEEHLLDLARGLFQLDTGPLVRIELIRLAPRRHILMWVAHHAVIDGWSYGVLIENFTQLYRAYASGGAAALDSALDSALPPPRLQFGDFALWQRDRLTGDRLEQLLSYWERALAGARCEITPDLDRPAAQTFGGRKVAFQFADDVLAKLAALCDQSGITQFNVLLSAFEIVVARYGGTETPVIGVPIAGRIKPELEPIVGPFSNTVPLRVDLTGDPTFTEVLGRMNDVLLDAAEHQEVPFSRLVDRMRSGRDASRNPLFQVLMNMGNLPQGVRTDEIVPGLTVRPRGVPNGTARVDLELTFEPDGDRLGGRLEYNVDLFHRRTVEELLGYLSSVLDAVAANPGIRLSALPPAPARNRGRPQASAVPPTPSRTAGRTSSWLRGH